LPDFAVKDYQVALNFLYNQKIVRLTAATQDLKDASDQIKVSISQISNQQNATSQTSAVTQTSTSSTLPGVTQPAGMSGIAGVLGVNPAPNQPIVASTASVPSNNTQSSSNVTSSMSTQSIGAGGNGDSAAQISSLPATVAGSVSGIAQNQPIGIVSGQQSIVPYPPVGYYPPPPPGYYPPPPGYYPPPNYYPQVSSGAAQSIPDSRQGNMQVESVMQPAAYPAVAQQNVPQRVSSYPAPGYYPGPGYYPPLYPVPQQGAVPQNYPSNLVVGYNSPQSGYQGVSQVADA
jgi:hypothetical protein